MHRFHVWHALALLGALFCPIPVSAQTTWSMGFLESAQDPTQRALVNYSAVTHIMDFGVHPVSDGTLTCDFGSEACNSSAFTTARAALITTAHSRGVKVLMCVTDANGASGFAGAASSGTLSTFVANIMTMVNTNGYDGVDLDWEASSYTTLMPGLISALRTALGSTRLLAVDAIPGTQGFWATNFSNMDRINFMTYDQEGNFNPYTWFNAALFSDPGDGEWSLDLMKRRAIAAGIPAGKINLGIPFYGYLQTGGPTGPRQSVAGNPPLSQLRYSSIVSTYPSQSANPTVDSVSQTPWFAASGGWVEYDNPASVTAKANYIKTNSLGGWILFSLNKDAPGQPLAAAVAAVLGATPPPTISSFTATPATIAPGGSSSLAWVETGGTTCSINQGVGVVPCSPASKVVTPAATTTYTLTVTNPAGSVTRNTTVTLNVVTVPNTTQAAIVSSISSACNGTSSGTVIFPNGTYPITSTINLPSNCRLQAQNNRQAILSANPSSGLVILSFGAGSANQTVDGLMFNGGYVLGPSSSGSPTRNLTFTNNTIQNVSAQNGCCEGTLRIIYLDGANISNNTFFHAWYGGWPSSPPANIGPDGLGPHGILITALRNVTISNNLFDGLGANAMYLGFSSDQTFGGNNTFSYNEMRNIHRAGFETQTWTPNTVFKGNYYHDPFVPTFWDSPFTLPLDHNPNLTAINNTAVFSSNTITQCPGNMAIVFELDGSPWRVQGNVAATIHGPLPHCTTQTVWSAFAYGRAANTSDVDTFRNNIWCGDPNILLFGNYPNPPVLDRQFEYTNASSCPAGSNLNASNINLAFTSANNQSFPSGGNGTWSDSVVSNLSIKWVQFFIDGSTTPITTQEIQDVNTNFANDRKWLYHATINTTPLAQGNHTITAVATDVSGATQSVLQNFTVGPVGGTPPTISSFTAAPNPVAVGLSSTLAWISTGGTTCSINNGIGTVTPCNSGSVSVSPLVTTTYILTVSNSTATVTQPLVLTVRQPASYFVSSSTGADTNAGTQASPWKTISKASAGPAGGYIPGDSVLLKAGDTWCQTGGTCAFPATFTANFTTPSSGTSGNPITYGTYGTVAAPILDGSGGFGVIISRNFITWNGIQIKNIAGTGILFSNTTGTQIRNVTATNVNNWAFKGYQVGTSTLDGNTCTSTSGFVQLSGCIIAQVNGATPHTQTITATHNTCHFDFLNTASSGGNVICVEVGGPVATNSSIVGNLSFGGTQFGGFKPGSCTGAGTADVCFGQVTGGLIADNEIHKAIFFGTPGSTTLVGDGETIELQGAATAIQTGVIVTRNVIYGQQSVGGVTGGTNVAGNTNDLIGLFQAQGNSIYGNVLVCPCGNEYAIQFETNAGGNSVFNNTIIQAPLNLAISNIPTQMAIRIGTDSNETIKNNIISGFAQGITGNSSNISDYNLFDSTVTSPVVGGILAGTNSLIGPTPASVFATTPAVLQNDVKLIAGSLAASAGLNLGVAFSQILDPSGAVVPYSIFTQTTSWEMGAFGTTLLAPARTVINGAVINGAVIQ